MKRAPTLTLLLGISLLILSPFACAQGGDIPLLNVISHGNSQEYSVKIQVLILMTLVVQDIFSGKVNVDTVQSIDSLTTIRTEELMNRSKEEDDFRRKYEERERAAAMAGTDDHTLPDLLFFRPTRGMVVKDFAPSRHHYGVDMAASVDESVLAALDGTVMLVVQTADSGVLIQIQHEQNFISIYKHCGPSRKKEGDQVKGGEVIALAGTSDEGKHVSHVHFELWHDGTPIDPAKYVVF